MVDVSIYSMAIHPVPVNIHTHDALDKLLRFNCLLGPVVSGLKVICSSIGHLTTENLLANTALS